MKRALNLGLCLFVAIPLLAACGAGKQGSGGESTSAESQGAAAAPAQSEPFSAVASSAIRVDLAWNPVDGANGYRVENQFGDSEWFVLAELGADATAYEDFPAPANMELNYRLIPLLGNGKGEALSASVVTPEIVPNPYTVQVTLEEPDYSNIGLEIPGFDPSTFDPSTFDPSTLDLSGLDPDNLDLSSLGPEPVTAHARIGPEGGTLSVTGMNGVIYTLDIPPGALSFSTLFSMTPVAELGEFPFSGGWMAAVQILPHGIYFDTPATLTFAVPVDEENPEPTDSGLIGIGFAFASDGRNFHPVPFESMGVSESYLPGSAAKVASVVGAPPLTIFRIDEMTLKKANSAGMAEGTPSERDNLVDKHPSDSPSDQADEQEATRDDQDSAEQQRAWRRADVIRGRLFSAKSAQQLVDALTEFREFFDSSDYDLLNEEQQDLLWDQALAGAFELLVEAKCPSSEAAAVQDLVRRLRDPKSTFDKEFARRFEEAYGKQGQDWLKALDSTQSCKVKLYVLSRVYVSDDMGTLRIWVEFEVPLRWRYDGRPFLQGSGDLKYRSDLPPTLVGGECTNFQINALDQSVFIVNELRPVFSPQGDLIDWNLRPYTAMGVQNRGSMDCGESRAEGGAIGGLVGDLWGGAVDLATSAGFQQKLGWEGWEIKPGSQSGSFAIWTAEDIRNRWDHGSASHTTLMELVRQ